MIDELVQPVSVTITEGFADYVIVPTRLGMVAEVFYERAHVPDRVDLIQYRQVQGTCPGESCAPFYTLVLDLQPDLEVLLRQVDSNARYEIRRASQRDNVTIEHLDSTDIATLGELWEAYDEFAASAGLSPISRPLVRTYSGAGLLRITRAHDADRSCTVWHVYLRTRSRARLLHSVSAFRSLGDTATKALHGRVNRLLHWEDIRWFKEHGTTSMDFGGWYAGTTDKKRLAVNEFKKQFGGKLVCEYNCHRALTARGKLILAAERVLSAKHILTRYLHPRRQ